MQGVVDKRPGSDEANFIVNELIPLDDLAKRFTRGMVIRLLEDVHGVRAVEQLYEILRGYPGDRELQIVICLSDGTRVTCACEGFRIEITPEMRTRVEELIGPGNLRFLVAPTASSGRSNGRSNGRRERR